MVVLWIGIAVGAVRKFVLPYRRAKHYAKNAEAKKIHFCKNRMQIRTMYKDAPFSAEVKLVVAMTRRDGCMRLLFTMSALEP